MLKCSVCGFENKVQDTCNECGSKIQRYVKAIPLCNSDDVLTIKKELDAGNVLIVNIIPFLYGESHSPSGYSKLKEIIEGLLDYATSIDGDAARIGMERLILAPSSIRIWGSHLESQTDSHH
jgi:uncharacterized protein